MKNVRVLMIVPQYPYPVLGGLEKQAHELAKALLSIDIQVQVISGKTHPLQSSTDIVENIQVHRITWHRKKWMRFIFTSLNIFILLIKNKNKYDIVHFHQYSWFSLYSVIICKVLGKRVLMKIPNGEGLGGLNDLKKTLFGGIKIFILKNTDVVIAMTKNTINALNTVSHPAGRILFIPNGVRMLTKEKINKGNDEKELCRVVFVGSINKEKGVFDLLYAWAHIINNLNNPAKLEFWGTGPLEEEIKELCKELGISNHVKFLGHVESVPEKLMEVDLFVLPSISEGNSNAILEAMAAGLPIISTRVGGALMQVGTIGEHYLFEPGDKSALCSLLTKLISNKKLRKKLGMAMYERSIAYFDINDIAKIYALTYSHLINKNSSAISDLNNKNLTHYFN